VGSSLELRRQLGVLRARYRLILVVIVLAGLGALATSLNAQRSYDSEAKVLVGQSLSATNPDLNQLAASQELSTTYAQIATTRPIMQGVIDNLGLKIDASTLQRQVAVEPSTDSALITIRVRDSDSQRAAAIANEVAAQLIAYSPTVQGQGSSVEEFVVRDLQTIQEQIGSIQTDSDRLAGIASPTTQQSARLETLQSRLLSLRSTYAALLSYATNSAVNHLAIAESAIAPSSPSSPQVIVNLVLGLAAGALVAVALAFLLDHLEDSIKTRDDAERATDLAVLGLIPRLRNEPRRNPVYGLVTVLYPRSRASEAFRALRTNIEFTAIAAPTRTILITSPQPLEGKTIVACNLAVVFAQAGKRTILVDADLRGPSVHRLFALSGAVGLTDLMLSDKIGIESVAQLTEQENLRVIASGSSAPNPAELLGSQRMRTIVDRLAAAADIVIFDCSPVNVVTDPAVLSTIVDGSILVIDSGHTHRDAARTAREALSMVGGRVLGLTLNRIPRNTREEAYGYYDSVATPATPSVMPSGVEGLAPIKAAERPRGFRSRLRRGRSGSVAEESPR
jgi:succinoglycan biosynthesis transport protein ExoP